MVIVILVRVTVYDDVTNDHIHMDISKVDRINKEDDNLQETSIIMDNWSIQKDVSIHVQVLVDIFLAMDVIMENDQDLHVIQVNGQNNYIDDEKIVVRNFQEVFYTD